MKPQVSERLRFFFLMKTAKKCAFSTNLSIFYDFIPSASSEVAFVLKALRPPTSLTGFRCAADQPFRTDECLCVSLPSSSSHLLSRTIHLPSTLLLSLPARLIPCLETPIGAERYRTKSAVCFERIRQKKRVSEAKTLPESTDRLVCAVSKKTAEKMPCSNMTTNRSLSCCSFSSIFSSAVSRIQAVMIYCTQQPPPLS